uniref:Uncharacterized protein n=1 Tax=Opuntia streptacantha TaxID=393608 RepID=A0A7C9DPP3_OPUST
MSQHFCPALNLLLLLFFNCFTCLPINLLDVCASDKLTNYKKKSYILNKLNTISFPMINEDTVVVFVGVSCGNIYPLGPKKGRERRERKLELQGEKINYHLDLPQFAITSAYCFSSFMLAIDFL